MRNIMFMDGTVNNCFIVKTDLTDCEVKLLEKILKNNDVIFNSIFPNRYSELLYNSRDYAEESGVYRIDKIIDVSTN